MIEYNTMKHHLQILALLVAGLSPLLATAETNAAPVAAAVPAAKPAAAAPAASTNAAAKTLLTVPSTNAAALAASTNVVAKTLLTVPSTNAAAGTNAVASAGTNKVAAAETAADDETAAADDEASDEAAGGTNAVPAAAVAEDPNFARYKTILDRMPFGPEPVGFNPDSGVGAAVSAANAEMEAAAAELAQQEEAQRMLASVRISAINVTPRGSVAVGFTDASRQPAATYYMKVGETRDGWLVKAADADPKVMSVTLERDGVEGTLKLGEGADPAAAKGKGGPGLANRLNAASGINRMAAGMGGRPGGFPMTGGRQPFQLGRPGAAGPQAGVPPENETAGDALARLRERRALKEATRAEETARAAAAAAQAEAEREKAAAEREKAAAERAQQREALLQIQEELRRSREAREQQQQQQLQNGEEGGVPLPNM